MGRQSAAASCACGWLAGISRRAEGLGDGTVMGWAERGEERGHLRAAAGGPLSIAEEHDTVTFNHGSAREGQRRRARAVTRFGTGA